MKNKPHFGRRAARRAARRRRIAISALVTAGAVLVGVPASTAPLEALGLVGGRDGDSRTPARAVEASESHAAVMRFRRELFNRRPPPKRPEPAASPASAEPEETAEGTAGGSIEDVIAAAAAEFGLDGAYLIGVASCESGLDPSAYNSAGYHGLFQFDSQTWAAYGYGSIWDPSAQARTAARLIAAGEASRWPNCA